MSAAQREIIHTEQRHLTDRRLRQRAEQAQHRAPTRRQAQRLGQPRAGPSSQHETDRLEHAAQHRRAPCIRSGQATDLFDERSRRAVRVIAEEPPDPQPDQHRATADRRIVQTRLITAVHPPRRHAAARTGRVQIGTPAADRDPPSLALDPLNSDTAQMRQ